MGDDEIKVKKATAHVWLSREEFEDATEFASAVHDALTARPGPPLPPPPDPGPHPLHVRLLAAAEGNPVLAELLDLHQPKAHNVGQDGTVSWWECVGDEYGGWEADPPDWPCETVGVIAKHLGVVLRGTDGAAHD